MKKSDLKTGYTIEYACGVHRVVMLNTRDDIISVVDRNDGWFTGGTTLGDAFDQDLQCMIDPGLAIAKVWTTDIFDGLNGQFDCQCPDWERPNEKMITVGDKEFSESTVKNALKDYIGY